MKLPSTLRHELDLRCIEVLEQRIAPATLIGLDSSNNLLNFDSATPGTVSSTVAVTGLGAGESLIGIDFRPATGALYGLTIDGANAGRLYAINSLTGAATFSAALTADTVNDLTPTYTSLSGTNFGVDFNPVPDRMRVVSDTNQNLRINVDTGKVITDADLNPSDQISAAAYTNAFAGATGTTLFDISVSGDNLLMQNPPNNGTLVPQGTGLGIGDITGVGGFDILSTRTGDGTVTNTGFAAMTVGGVTGLYNINVATGLATSIGAIGAGSTPLRGLTTVIGNPSANAFTVDSANNHLLRFNTATPSATSTDLGAISGLGAGESIIGFDFRPADGQLFLVTKDAANAGRLYTVNTATAAATSVGALVADGNDVTSPYTGLNGTNFGVDFNPVANRLRIVSDAGQNLRINVDTQATITDGDLNGAVTAATAAAYTNNFQGTGTTRLFDIDAATDDFLEQTNPNGGTIAVVGGLGVNATAINGFDISTNGQAFAALTVGGVAQLYSISLTSGAATLVGGVNGVTGSSLGLALAPSGAFQFASQTLTVGEGAGTATLTINRVGGSDGAASVVVTTANGSATAGSDYTAVSQVVTFGAGVTSQNIQVPITQDVLIEGTEIFTATLSDAAGAALSVGAPALATVTITDDEPTGFGTTALIGLDSANNLVSFSNSAPGTITSTTPVTGLNAGETLIGIDFRPATGGLYGLAMDAANAGRLYVINPTTGAATFSATLAADPADVSSPYTSLSGANFGMDFNPVPDRLRVVSDTNQNLRINVDTGLVTTDTPINPPGSTLAGAAYLNSFAGSTSTTLFDIDIAGDRLVTQNPPNDGTLTNPLPLGVDATGIGGFDIVSTRSANGTVTNTSFAALTVGGATGLYTIDLTTGVASTFGAIGDGTTALRGLTSATGAPAAKAFTVDASNNHLLSFNVATPVNTTDVGMITGLGVTESIVGFDFRPANGQLYLVTKDTVSSAGTLYTVDTATAVATSLGALAADGADSTLPYTTLSGTNFGVDFNPFADRLRIVSDSGQNLRVNVDTRGVTTDTDLNGGATAATAAAYTNNFAGTASTTLFDIDAGTDQLYTQNPPNNGTLVATGALGVDATAVNGFDIRANGQAFASLTVGGVTGLYSINLTTGAATAVGSIGNGVNGQLGLALVSNGTFQFASTAVTAAEDGGTATLTINRVGGSDGTATVNLTTADGTTIAGTDYTGLSRTVTFGPGVTQQTVNITLFDDASFEGNETFTATLTEATGGAAISASNVATVTIADDETAPTISIADVALAEGNLGTTNFTFTVQLSGTTQTDVTMNYSSVAGTATAGEDFVGVTNQLLTIPAGQTSGQFTIAVNGDLDTEASETFTVQLSDASANATFADSSATGTILNDDGISTDNKLITYTDADGDVVSIKINNGTLTENSVVFAPSGPNGGVQLVTLDLTDSGFANSNVTITARRSAAGGDGFVNVGYINAGTNALGKVSINGDLGQIDAGAVKSLTAQSLGKFGTTIQGGGGSLLSSLSGNLGKLTVKTDVVGAGLAVTGKIGPIKIGGNLVGTNAAAPGSIIATGDIGAVSIAGDIVGGTTDHTGSLEAGGKIAKLSLGGSLVGGSTLSSGSIIAKTSGALKIRGDIDSGRILIAGNLQPASSKLATALASLSVTGSVSDAAILVGFDRDAQPVNADVRTGAVKVTGDWTASSFSAGITAVDGIFGNDNDTLITASNNSIIARIASIAIKGQVTGTSGIDTDGFGFVSEQIGSFKVGKTKFPLSTSAIPDNLLVGATGDVRVREFIV